MTDLSRLEALFAAARVAPPDVRAAVLTAACAGDADLRAQVERLLAADAELEAGAGTASFDGSPGAPPGDSTASFPGGPSAGAPDQNRTAAHTATPDVGTVLDGKFKLLEEIGEGGMGAVWMAQQTEPVKRSVAIKLIKPGMDSRAVLARFEAERQALAVMDHPNIAKVLDAGTAPDGRPYFVMELVKGVSITKYCDANKLTPQERLALFIPVCQAVQHAHQKGVIHRDIKPSNVLVALYDDKPVPKVIDFGVAKATSQPLTDKTLHTAYGAVIGTPAYMSPEQATLNNLDIDTRSDVYALGVLLYELLTGSPPFSPQELSAAGLLEMLRVIREVEPQRPSTRLSTADALPSVSASRGTAPARLTALVRGELDWIVMRALEKDRARRYDTAAGLAADVERYLVGDRVHAVPPSAGYRLRKFYRRNRGPVLAAGLVFLVLVAGVVGTTYGLWRSDKAARRETARSAQLERSNNLLKSVFKTLDPHEADQAAGPLRAQFARRLREAVADLDGDAVGDPLSVARMQYLLGVSLLGLGYSDDAVQVLTKARDTIERELGPDSEEAMHAVAYLGDAHADLGHDAEAERLHADVLARRTRVLGPDHPDTLVSQSDYATKLIRAHRPKEAVPLMESALAKHTAARGPDHTFTLLIAANLAHTLGTVGRREEGLKLSAQTLARSRAAFGPNHPRVVNAACVHAAVLHMDRKTAEAVRLLEETLAGARTELGADHQQTLNCVVNLAAYLAVTDNARATALATEGLALWTARSGPRHPHTLAAAAQLATCHLRARKFEACVAVAQNSLSAAETHLGPDADLTLSLVQSLSEALIAQNQTDRGLALAERHLAGIRRIYPDPDCEVVLIAVNDLGVALQKARMPARALPLFEEAAAGRTRLHGLDHVETCVTRHNVALALGSLKRQAEALPILEDVTRRLAALEPKQRPEILGQALRDLGRAYRELKRLKEALDVYTRSVEVLADAVGADAELTLGAVMERTDVQYLIDPKAVDVEALERLVPRLERASGPTHSNTLKALHILMQVYRLSGQFDKLPPVAVKRADRMRTAHGPDAELTLQAESELGTAYREAGQNDRAAEVLRELVRKREKLNGKDDARTLEDAFYLGSVLVPQGAPDEGWSLMERAVTGLLKVQPATDETTSLLAAQLGQMYRDAKKFDRAVGHLETAVRRLLVAPGPDNPDTRQAVMHLNQTYFWAGRPANAVPTCELIAKWIAAEKGEAHVETAQAFDRLALAYRAAKRLDDAIAVRRRVHAAFVKAKGPDDPNALVTLALVADESFEAGHVADAIRDFELVRAGWIRVRGPVAPETLRYTNRLGVLYWNNQQFEKSIPLYENLLAAQRKAHGDAAHDTLQTMFNLGSNYCDGGRPAEGIPLLKEVLRSAKEEDLQATVRGTLILHYLALDRTADAEPLARDHIAAARAAHRADDPGRATELSRAAEVYLRLNKCAEAEPLLREALAVREKSDPGSFRTAMIKSLLGRSLAGQKKVAAAEPLLLDGYAGLAKDVALIPPISRYRVAEAADALVEFYTATNKSDEVAKWRAERAKYPFVAPPPRPVAGNGRTGDR